MCRNAYKCSNSDRKRDEDYQGVLNYLNKWDIIFEEFMQLNGTNKDMEYNWWKRNHKRLKRLLNEFNKSSFYKLFRVFVLEEYIDEDRDVLYKYIVQNLCGSDNIEKFNSLIELFLLKEKIDKLSAADILDDAMKGLGTQIVYSPNNQITQKIMDKFNEVIKPIRHLSKASSYWTKSVTNDVKNYFFNDLDKKMMSIYKSCERLKNIEICEEYLEFYDSNYKQLKTKSMKFITKLFEFVKVMSKELPSRLVKPATEITDNSIPYAHVEFGNIPNDSATLPKILNYTIMMKQQIIDKEYKYLIMTDGFKVLPESYHPYLLDDEVDKYYHSGFLTIQQIISHSFIELTTNESIKIGTSLQYTPFPCTHFKIKTDNIFTLLPIVLTVCWIICYTYLLNNIVSEKEMGIKEYLMKLEDLNEYNNFVEFISFILENIPIGILVSLLLTVQFYEIKQIFELIMLHSAFFTALSAQIFVLSTLFTSAKLAGLIGSIIYMFCIYPCYFYMDKIDFNSGLFLLFSILPQSGYGIALDRMRLSVIENNNMSSDIIFIVLLMVLSTIVSLIMFHFSDTIISIKLFRIFKLPAMPQFTCLKNSISAMSSQDSIQMNASNIIFRRADSALSFEEITTNDNVRVKIMNINKMVGNKLQIIRNLNLNLYNGKILSIVGHNGAGKTTTLSMIAGLIKPDSGTIQYYNSDAQVNIHSKNRVMIGLCPQTNVLYDNLTVVDHIIFYSQLRGVSLSLAIMLAPKIMNELGLDYERNHNIQVRYLSPGYKRRLCIVLAFIGDVSVVLLDEPTSCIDLSARRNVWNMLLNMKSPRKTIVISTNSMEEADYLSDHVAVLGNGELISFGTPIYLKKNFGRGYYLELELDQDLIKINSYIQNDLKDEIKQIAPDAKLITYNRNCMVFALKNKIQQIINLLKALREKGYLMSEYGVLNYGVYDTTLEESYMRIIEKHHIGGRSRLYRKKQSSFENSDQSIDLSSSVIETNSKATITGLVLWIQQIKALIIKRFYFELHNRIYFLLSLAIPIVLLMLHLLFHYQPIKLTDGNLTSLTMPIHPWLLRQHRKKLPSDHDSKNALITFFKRENLPNDLFKDKKSTYENFYFGIEYSLPNPADLEHIYSSKRGNTGIACLMDEKVPYLPKCNKNSQVYWYESEHYSFNDTTLLKCKCTKYLAELSCNTLTQNQISKIPQTLTSVNDILLNLSNVNLSDYLYKNYKTNKLKLFGGYQFLVMNKYSLILKQFEKSKFLQYLQKKLQNSNPFFDDLKSYLALDSEKLVYTRVWANPKGFISSTAYINIFDNLLLQLYSKEDKSREQSGIFVSVKPSDLYKNRNIKSFVIHSYLPFILALSRLVVLVVSITFILSSFMIFIIYERTSNIKLQQLISGLSSELYWFVNFIWDYLKYIILSSILIALLVVFRVSLLTSNDILIYFILLIYLGGAALILQVYLLSTFFHRPIVGFVSYFLMNLFLIIFSLTICVVFESVPLNEYSTSTEIFMNKIMKTFIFIPQVNVGRGFFNLTFKYYNYQLRRKDSVSHYYNMGPFNPMSWEILGNTFNNLILNIILELILLSLFEHWQFLDQIFCFLLFGLKKLLPVTKIRNSIGLNKLSSSSTIDVDVINESHKIHKMSPHMLNVKIENLKKLYFNMGMLNCRSKTNNYMAVNGISFGVVPGECFGLLGVNGAGKSTVFNMLIGRERITSGNAFVSGVNIRSGLQIRHNIGYCPQDDALHDLLTVRQELHLYCSLRGIPVGKISNQTIQNLLEKLILLQYSNKLIRDLSGGNKRKLSVAIALIGNPNVVLLDEPTAGTDLDARHHIWDQIQFLTSAQQNRSVILTTHSMQDCETLCNRLAIMVNGEIKCIGNKQNLKRIHGGYYMLTIRGKENTNKKLQRILENKFSGKLKLFEENIINNVYRFKENTLHLDFVFEVMNDLKDQQYIKDFSINEINLSDIFIKIADANK